MSAESGLAEKFNYVILLRHGTSKLNTENRFAGWMDTDLTPQGEEEADNAGLLLRESGIKIDETHSSLLQRAIKTGERALERAGQGNLIREMILTVALNERHYGGLQGLNKAETAAEYGEEQVAIWRRSYDVAPPPDESGMTESLKDVVEKRTGPYFKNVLIPAIKEGKNILVAAHGNSLRAGLITMGVRNPESIFKTELANGVPLVFKFKKATHQIVDAFSLTKEGRVPFVLPSTPFSLAA